jgi:hypothetical protein
VISEDFFLFIVNISSHYSFNYNIILCCRLGQGAQALNKAIDSGDTDLIYHVILTLQVITSVKNKEQIYYWYGYEREEGWILSQLFRS